MLLQEFEVVSANFSAEYGRASGGVVNTVTRSGTNALHTLHRLTGLYRNQDFINRRTIPSHPLIRLTRVTRLAEAWAAPSSRTSCSTF